MRNIWKCDGNIQHLRKSGGIGAYLFQSCVLLLVNVSSICLGKGFAPLRCTCTLKFLRGCGWAMAAARSWGGRISPTVCFFFCVCVCVCSSVLWPNCGKHLTSSLVLHFFHKLDWRWKASRRHFVLAPACGNYSVKNISGLLNVSFT